MKEVNLKHIVVKRRQREGKKTKMHQKRGTIGRGVNPVA